jgi:hypothetical protein
VTADLQTDVKDKLVNRLALLMLRLLAKARQTEAMPSEALCQEGTNQQQLFFANDNNLLEISADGLIVTECKDA